MLGKLSDQDLALLSAYLDGELKQSDHQRVVARLEHEADLRAALTTLRQLKGTLRSLPQPQAKRHFTLGPEHARLSLGQRLGLANSWGLASAAASLLLVLVFAGELLTFGNPFAPDAALLAETAVMAQDEAFGDMAAAEMAEEAADAPMPMEAQPEADDAAEAAGMDQDDAAIMADEFAAPKDEGAQEAAARAVEGEVAQAPPIAPLSAFRWAQLVLGLTALLSFGLARRRV